MVIDEELYRQYLRGDEAGLETLMRKYGNPLTLYIDGYLHDVHEAEDLDDGSLFLPVHKKAAHPGRMVLRPTCIKQRGTWLCATKAGAGFSSALMT